MDFANDLHTINFGQNYSKPIVFLGPITHVGDDVPIIARVVSVSSSRCSVMLQQPHTWLGGPPNVHGEEDLTYLVLEEGVWQIDDAGNTIEAHSLKTRAAAGLETVSIALRRRRGPRAALGRRTNAVVLSQVQTVNNPLMTRSVIGRITETYATLSLETERVIRRASAVTLMPPDANNAVRNLRLSTHGPRQGKLSGILLFDPPLAALNATQSLATVEAVFASSRSLTTMLGVLPFAKMEEVPTKPFSWAFENLVMPSTAQYIIVVTRPLRGTPAYVPIIPDEDNPWHPNAVPLDIDPLNIPLVDETVGVLVMSAGTGLWDGKGFIANSLAPLPMPATLSWVDYLNPESKALRPSVTFESPPSTYLAALDVNSDQQGAIPAHLTLGESFAQSVDRSSARMRLEVENKRDRSRELPTSLTVSYLALVQQGLLSASKASCPKDCSGVGVCIAGMCQCDTLHGGEDCSLERDGSKCSPRCEGAHTLCLNGKCECENGFAGDDCSVSLADLNPTPLVVETCPRNCSGHGKCTDVLCTCEAGWIGEDCSEPVCVEGCNEAVGGGACVRGRCVCATTYAGAKCELRVCVPDPACSNNGACQEGTCVCNKGWQGPRCSDEIPVPVCPNLCSGHGDCVEGKCTCAPGFEGDDCSKRIKCPDGDWLGETSECGGHGYCDVGTCVCSAGWIGSACTDVDPHWITGCPFDCSGRGRCTPAGCVCDEPYGGRGCRQMSDSQLVMAEVMSVVVTLSLQKPVHTVSFPRAFRSPVVFAKPPSRSKDTPLAIQILGVASDHCNITAAQAHAALLRTSSPHDPLQQSAGNGEHHDAKAGMWGEWNADVETSELVTLLVVEEGSWDLRNGLLLHVGKVPAWRVAHNHGALPQGFPRFFSEQPAVLAQTQNTPGVALARARVRASYHKNFVLGMDTLQTADASKEVLDAIELGWLALGPSGSSVVTGNDPNQKFRFGTRPFFWAVRVVSLADSESAVAFPPESNLATPRVLADAAFSTAFNLRYHALSKASVTLSFETAQGARLTESGHFAVVSVLAFGSLGPLHAHALQCPDKCGYDGERGMCVQSHCQCEPGWASITCKVPATKCPNNCSLNGACVSLGCKCHAGWTGPDCSKETPRLKVELLTFSGVGNLLGANMAGCEDDCSGHGVCEHGSCRCTDPDWHGDKCHIPNPCINKCSGHGTCLKDQGCKCDGGWGGEACDQPTLMCPYDYDCNKGQCVEGRCVCDDEHFGFNCDRLIGDKARFEAHAGMEPVA
eukprot:c14241_g1_i1.p1 GENE.c14241_g1_i1~~c14241_g1_i1.p1  ORF type:complete len:1257 (-),score=289.69 c14241_g1_i1:161-3931(-)